MSKSFNKPLEKLGDTSLKNISGGKTWLFDDIFVSTATIGTPVCVLGSMGCGIARFVCQNKASKCMQQGDKSKSEKYSKAAKGFEIATISCMSLTVGGILMIAEGWVARRP